MNLTERQFEVLMGSLAMFVFIWMLASALVCHSLLCWLGFETAIGYVTAVFAGAMVLTGFCIILHRVLVKND